MDKSSMKKETRGGVRKGQGRKPTSEQGAKLTTTCRLLPNVMQEITGRKQFVIETGVNIALPLVQKFEVSGTDACLLAYNAICVAIQTLEVRRGLDLTEPETWTPDEAKLHTLLNRFYDDLRNEVTFYEPKI